jgi:ABC-2 type transport system permease protein
MSAPTFAMSVRLRLRSTLLTALGMASVILMVGALFPAVGDSIGKLDLPEGVSELLGGADYATITGWMRSEIGAVYGPLVIAATAITAAAGSTAGEEESGILGLVLAHPIARSRLVLEKAGAVAVGVLTIAVGTWLGLVVGVAVAGGGISVGHQAALAVHLAFFGFASGAVALALAGITGRKAVAAGGAGAFAVAGFLINGFAPLVHGVSWLKYASPFYYYAGNDPLAAGSTSATSPPWRRALRC